MPLIYDGFETCFTLCDRKIETVADRALLLLRSWPTLRVVNSATSLSRRYQVPTNTLVQLNHLTSPNELYAGTTLVIPQREGETFDTQRAMVTAGQSLFELAISQGDNPWEYSLANGLKGTWGAIPSDILHIPSAHPAFSAPPHTGLHHHRAGHEYQHQWPPYFQRHRAPHPPWQTPR